jgi:hypothetical protein
VCRHGVAVKASIDSVPASIAAVFQNKLADIDERMAAQDLGEWQLISTESLEQGLRLVVEVHCVHNVTVMSSRLTNIAEAGPEHSVFHAQQSFYRRIEQHVHSQSSPVHVVFRLWHLLLNDDSISSGEMTFSDYTRVCSGRRQTRELEQKRQLACDGWRCGELLPGTSDTQPFVCGLNRNYIHMLLLSRLHQYLANYA